MLCGMTFPGKQPGPPVFTLQASRAEGIADVPQHAGVVARLREVAVALQRRRHGAADQERIGPRHDIQRVEEEQLVAVLVELQARDQHRSAQRERRVVIPVPRLLAQRRRPAGRVARAPPVPGVRVEPFVPLEVRRRSAEPGAAALGHDDDVGAARPAVFGLVVRRLNLHFGDGVERGGHVVGRAEPRVLAGDAVVRHPHDLIAEPVDLSSRGTHSSRARCARSCRRPPACPAAAPGSRGRAAACP